MKALIPLLLFGVSIAHSFFVAIHAEPPGIRSSVVEIETPLPTEIIVTPSMNRRHLRSLISQVEEDFVKRFNELNTNDDYDIDCYKYRNTRSHIRKKICEPVFFRAARRQDASLAALNINQLKKKASEVVLLELIQVQSDGEIRSTHKQEYKILQEKIVNLTNSDQALQTLINNLNELNYGLENYGKD